MSETRFCHKCGATLPAGATFCPKCGTPVALAPASGQPVAAYPSTQPTRYEKHEKQEKREKQEKNEKGEKGRGGDLAGALTGGLILILLGILFYLSTVGNTVINYGNFWEYFLIGVGVILIFQGLLRYSEGRRSVIGSFIGGAVLIIIGFAFVTENNIVWWPLILVVLGIAAIVSAFSSRRRAPRP